MLSNRWHASLHFWENPYSYVTSKWQIKYTQNQTEYVQMLGSRKSSYISLIPLEQCSYGNKNYTSNKKNSNFPKDKVSDVIKYNNWSQYVNIPMREGYHLKIINIITHKEIRSNDHITYKNDIYIQISNIIHIRSFFYSPSI